MLEGLLVLDTEAEDVNDALEEPLAAADSELIPLAVGVDVLSEELVELLVNVELCEEVLEANDDGVEKGVCVPVRVLEGEPVEVLLILDEAVPVTVLTAVLVEDVVGLIERVSVIDRVDEGLPELVLEEVAVLVPEADPEALFDTDAEALADRVPPLLLVCRGEYDEERLAGADLLAVVDGVIVVVNRADFVLVTLTRADLVPVGVRVDVMDTGAERV